MKELKFKEFFKIAKKKKLVITIILIASILLGLIYTFKIVRPKYESTTTILLSKIENLDEEKEVTDNTISNTVKSSYEIIRDTDIYTTYNEVLNSNEIIDNVRKNLNINLSINEIKDMIHIKRVSKGNMIKISVKSIDADLSCRIADELSRCFNKKIQEFGNGDEVKVIDKPVVNTSPINIYHSRDLIIFVILGLIVSGIYVILSDKVKTKVDNAERVEEKIGLKTLAHIPFIKNKKEISAGLNDVLDKSIENLITNIQFSNVNLEEKKTILVTSCYSGEGKTFVSTRLAKHYASLGKKVVIIDTDMANGDLASVYNIPEGLGLSNYLSGLNNKGIEIHELLNKYIKETSVKNLNVITSGNIPPNPSELLTSEKLELLIKDLSVFFDIIILDSAPILPVPDSLMLSRICKSTLLVSVYKKTNLDELHKAKKDISNIGGRIIGIAINKIPFRSIYFANVYRKIIDKNKIEKKIKKEKAKEQVQNAKENQVDEIERVPFFERIRMFFINLFTRKKTKLLDEALDQVSANQITIEESMEEISKQNEKDAEEVKEEIAQEIVEPIDEEPKKGKKRKKKNKEKIEETAQEVVEPVEEQKEEVKPKEKQSFEHNNEMDSKNTTTEIQIDAETALWEITNAEIQIQKERLAAEKRAKEAKRKERIADLIDFKNSLIEEFKEKARARKAEKERIKEEKEAYLERQKVDRDAYIEQKKMEEKLEEEQELQIEAEQRRIEEEEYLRLQQEKQEQEEMRRHEKELERQERETLKEQKREDKKRLKEEQRRIREERRQEKASRKRQEKEEAMIQEDLLDDNLYPKIKYNKDL